MRKASLFKVIASTCSILLIVSSVNATSISDYYKQMNEIKAKQKAAAEQLTGVEKEIQEKEDLVLRICCSSGIYYDSSTGFRGDGQW